MKITLADLTAEPTTFELNDHAYVVQKMTRAVQIKHDAAGAKLRASDDDEDNVDKNVDLLAKCIETLFVGDAAAPPLAKALLDAWKKDAIGLGQLHALYEGAQEAAFARPTSRRTT